MENTNTFAPPDKLRVLDLFSGIGGFSLGLERTGGFETAAFCEIEPFPRKVLAKHWPGVKCYEDVTKLTGDILKRDGISVDVITGGFPCQDISCAGKQAGIGEGTRSGLWSEIVRLIGELSPRYVVVENVAALLSGPSEQRGGWFGRILGDLAECGYDAEWRNIPAWLVGCGHKRERVWLVAYPQQERRAGILPTFASEREASEFGRAAAAASLAASRRLDAVARGELDGESPFFNGTYGLSKLVGGLAAGGNAVAPAIPELIGRAILAAESAGAR
jgi:DNA (cytosine-5)-methyltransferase 1